MADQKLGRFVFEFVSDVKNLKKGNEEASKSVENLTRKIDQLVISNDHTVSKMMQLGQILIRAANSFDKIASSAKENIKANRESVSSYENLNEKLEENTKLVSEIKDSGKKNIENTDKQNLSLTRLTKTLLGVAAAYFSVKNISKGAKESFVTNFDLVKSSDLLTINTNRLKAWVNVAKGLGVSGSEIINVFQSMTEQLGQIEIEGALGPLGAAANILSHEGFTLFDKEGNALAVDEIFLQLSEVYEKIGLLNKEEAAAFNFLMKRFGIQEGGRRVILAGREKLQKRLIEQERRIPQLTNDQIESIKELNQQWEILKQVISDTFTRGLLPYTDSAISKLKKMQTLIGVVLPMTLEFIGDKTKNIFSKGKSFLEGSSSRVADWKQRDREFRESKNTLTDISQSPLNTFNTNNVSSSNQGSSIVINKIEVNTQSQDGQSLANELYDGIMSKVNNQTRTNFVETNEQFNNARKI